MSVARWAMSVLGARERGVKQRSMRKEDLEKFLDGHPVGIVLAYGIGIPLYVAFGAAYLSGSLWFYLIVVVPALLYEYSGPIKWTIDPIRSFLHGLVLGPPENESPENANPQRKTIECANAKCLSAGLKCGIHPYTSLIGNCIGVNCIFTYFVGSIVLLVFYIMYITDPRADKIRNYDTAVQKWQEGLAKEYESTWTSRQLPTLYLKQYVNDVNQTQPLTYEPPFQLETYNAFEEFLPQLHPDEDMQKYEDKVLVAATVENFHTPSIHSSESDEALKVRIGEQTFTFATVHQWKTESDTGDCHYDTYLNGSVFVFNEEVQKHACALYYNPELTCHRKWPSLYPPADIVLRVEIRSPHDPVIVASDLFGCPTTDGSWGETMKYQWHRITIFAYVLGCSACALFLFITPGSLWKVLEWDPRTANCFKRKDDEPKEAKQTDVESGAITNRNNNNQNRSKLKFLPCWACCADGIYNPSNAHKVQKCKVFTTEKREDGVWVAKSKSDPSKTYVYAGTTKDRVIQYRSNLQSTPHQ